MSVCFGIFLNILIIPLAQIAMVSAFLMLLFGWFNPLRFVLSYSCRFSASFMILLPGKLLLFHMQLLMYPKIKFFLQ